jgi:flagellar biosynthetic protein FlhB
MRACVVAASVGLVFAVAEYGAVRRSWLRKLRMSFDEFKREIKEQDGDPMTRSRRKSLHRSLLRGSLKRVRDAAFVVVNPTHVAVALEYRPPSVTVPVVLVRAADAVALQVRDLARERGIPIVENPPLARALFSGVAAGAPISPEHYAAVAEVVIALHRSGALA